MTEEYKETTPKNDFKQSTDDEIKTPSSLNRHFDYTKDNAKKKVSSVNPATKLTSPSELRLKIFMLIGFVVFLCVAAYLSGN